MRIAKAWSVRQKLLAVVMLTTSVALVVAIAAIVAYDLRVYHQTLLSDMATQADLLGRTTAPALTFDDAQMARENLGFLQARPQVHAAAIYNARGGLFATYIRPGQKLEFPALPEIDGVEIQGRALTVYKRIVENGEIAGTVYLRADYELFERILSYLSIAVVVIAVSMLIAFLMSTRLEKVVTRPILAIAGIAREVMDQRDYSRRAEKISDDEVGVLVTSFNGMLAEIERRNLELETSNQDLAKEVNERSRAEQEILRLNEQLEERVRERTAQLESTNQELEAFCYSVSHDLRSPLRGIDGFSAALLEDFPEHIPEEGKQYLAKIRYSTLRMGQLIEDLLNLSRVSRATLQRQPTDLTQMAKQVINDLQQREPDRTVDVSIWDGMSAEADPRLLQAALENLIGNAWKFTARTEKPHIEIGALPDSGRTVFFVRDNGAGFDMAYADKLFGAFQRLHSESDYSGTGIGLATVQRIVLRHGGRIWAEAQVGKGAVFFFTLSFESQKASVPIQKPGDW